MTSIESFEQVQLQSVSTHLCCQPASARMCARCSYDYCALHTLPPLPQHSRGNSCSGRGHASSIRSVAQRVHLQFHVRLQPLQLRITKLSPLVTACVLLHLQSLAISSNA
jgi:hypothetical protein